MKIVLNLLLVAAACVLTYMCFLSIQIPVQFNEECAKRDAVIIQRLKDIRSLQEAHRDKYQTYCGSWAELIKFAKTDSVPIVDKIGTLTDDQLAAGLTSERQAWEYLQNPKKYAKEIEKYGLSKETFSRDTIYVNVLKNDSALSSRPDFNIDEIAIVPFSQNNDTFKLELGSVQTASGYEMALFQANVEYAVYLWDLHEQELANKIEARKQMDKFPGIQVGDATQANNNAGNWE